MPGGGLADLVADAELEKAAGGARRPRDTHGDPWRPNIIVS